MIYLSEEFMDVEKGFREGAFTERKGNYYFVVEEKEEDLYLCVKLFKGNAVEGFEIEIVEVSVDWKKEDEIEDEAENGMKADIEYALDEFFRSLSNIESIESVKIYDEMLDMVKDYFEDAYFYNEGKRIIGEFMRIFEISGTLDEGSYPGTIILKDVEFRNRMTNQIITKFYDISIEGLIDCDENEMDYMLESLAENMSPYEIMQILESTFETEK